MWIGAQSLEKRGMSSRAPIQAQALTFMKFQGNAIIHRATRTIDTKTNDKLLCKVFDKLTNLHSGP